VPSTWENVGGAQGGPLMHFQIIVPNLDVFK